MIDGIWNNDYICKLGILDHCREVILIDTEIKINKNKYEIPLENEVLEDHFNKECIDLMLILMKYFNTELLNTYDNPLINERINKFKEKAEQIC